MTHPTLGDPQRRLRALGRRAFEAALSAWWAFPDRLQCNLCGWSGRRFFSDGWHDGTRCPRCGSQVRHRLLFAMLQRDEGALFKALFAGKRVLHFAPEPPLARAAGRLAAKVVTADLFADGMDLRLDLSAMDSVPEGAFDLLIACDVLEHVPDDTRALREIRRVLAPGGTALLTVPQKDGLATTYEDPAVTTDEGRERAYGISNHHRIYGDDFPQVLARAGFAVQVFDHSAFPAETCGRHVLHPPVLSRHPSATNHRRIFLARKP